MSYDAVKQQLDIFRQMQKSNKERLEAIDSERKLIELKLEEADANVAAFVFIAKQYVEADLTEGDLEIDATMPRRQGQIVLDELRKAPFWDRVKRIRMDGRGFGIAELATYNFRFQSTPPPCCRWCFQERGDRYGCTGHEPRGMSD